MTESPRLSPMPRRIRDSSVAPSQGDSPISATPTSAFLRRLPLSPAVASSANSYESPTIPSALSSTLQDSDLVSPRSISSNPYAKLSSATPQSPSISVGRSSSTGRSLKEKTGGFLSRLFSSRSKSRERDRGREKDRVRDHPRETSLSSKGSIPSIDNVRFQHVKAVDARTSTKKLISPSNNDFAVMFPSMVRPKDDVPASADTGFKVYTVTVHSFNDTKHVKISESDDGFMVRFEIYKAFQIPASQMSGCFSMYNSKEFHSNNSDLSDDDLFQLCRQTHIPDLILIPTTGRQSETYPKIPQPTKATNEEGKAQDAARSTAAEHENTPPLPLSPPQQPVVSKKPKPSLHISTSVASNPVNISETSHNPPVKRVMVETPMTASPSALVGGDPRPRANSSSSQVKFLEDDLKSADSLGTSPIMARRPKRIGTVAKSRLSKQAPIANGIVIQKDVSSSNLYQKDFRSGGVSMPRTNRNTNPPALAPVAATMPRSLLPLPPNTTAITSSSKDFIPVAVSSRHILRHSNAYDDLRQGVLEFGDRPSAPTIVQNLNNFFPSIVVDEKEAAEFSISRSSTSSGENSLSRVGGATSAANSLSGIKIRDGSLLVSKDTVRIMRENSERSVASATSSLGRLAGPSKLGLMSADSADGEEFKEEVTSVVVPGSLRDTHALEVGSPTFSFDYLQNTTLDRSAYATVDRPEGGLDRVPTSSVLSLWRTRADEIAIKRNVTDVWKEKVAGLGSGGLFLSLDAKAIQKPSEGLSPTSEGISPTKSFESDTSQDTDGISPSEEKQEPLHDELLPPLISRRTKRHTWKGFVPQPGVPDDEQLVPYNGEDNLPRQQTSSPVQDELMESSFDNIAIVPPAAEVDVIDHHHEPHPRSTIDELKAASSAEPSHIKFWKGKMIGQGSFGAVYFGVNIATSELIAVKQVALVPLKKTRGGGGKPYAPLPPSRVNKMVDALSVEISLLRELSHDNVVRYLGFDVVENVVSVFLEYVDGGSLATMISRYGRFDYALAQSVTHQVLSGLEYLHDRCIIHRDIKGANILVNRLGVAKIADFGISKKNEYKYQTNSRMSMQGTVYWMAPEVMANKGGYSAKVDIWSLGCVVYEMLQGHAPWKDLNEMQIMWKVGMEHATPPVPASLRDDAKEFLERCFVIEPEDRPTATELFSCEFQRVDYLEFNFEEWWNRVESQRLAREAAEEAEDDDDDDEDDNDNDSDSFDEMGDSDDSQD